MPSINSPSSPNQASPIAQQTSYEKMLDRNYSMVGESSETMIRRKADTLRQALDDYLPGARLKILDFGCGVGLFEKVLKDWPRLQSLTGMDMCPVSIQEARKAGNGRFLLGQGREMPFRDGEFDGLFTASTLHHVEVPDRPQVVREMARVIRPGGFVGVFEHNPYNPVTRFFVHICPIDKGVTLVKPGRLRVLLKEAGLEVLETRYVIFFPTFLKPLCEREHALRAWPVGTQYLMIARKPEKPNE